MKVDKSVCTNDIFHDINRVIKFEKVFTTLVENKVLAIKRDCELKKRNKRLRSIGRILIRKKKVLNETATFQTTSKVIIYDDDEKHAIALYDFQIPSETQEATETESCLKEKVTTALIIDDLKPTIAQPEEASNSELKLYETPDKDIDRLSPTKTYSKDTLDDTYFCETKSTFSDPIHSTRKNLINNQLEKYPKSISAQSSPILSSHRLNISLGSEVNCCTESQHSTNIILLTQQNVSTLSDNNNTTITTSNINNKHNNNLITNNSEKTSPIKKTKSQVKQAKNSSFTTTRVNCSKINRSNNNSVEKKSKHLKTIRGLPHLEYELDYDDDDKTRHGFLESFNLLTKNVRVIATTKPKKSQLEKIVSTSSSAKTDSICKEIENIDSKGISVDCVNETMKAQKKRASTRRSEPVLAHPSGGQCILARPPNQPIQLQYDEDYMFDVSLQLEAGNGNVDAILSDRKKSKHRHHHHHHHKKQHKRQRMLVHDLDNQKVKVIDPDDLPQRARWTIIATAFLLLIMCLFLVGVTLRMAPIIDDMVATFYYKWI